MPPDLVFEEMPLVVATPIAPAPVKKIAEPPVKAAKAVKEKKRKRGKDKNGDAGMTEGPEILVASHTVREWKPLHTTETLPEIEAIIDSWGPPRVPSRAQVRISYAPVATPADLENRVDRLLKTDRQQTVVLAPDEAGEEPSAARPTKKAAKRKGFLSRFRRGKTQEMETESSDRTSKSPATTGSGDKDYKPQCSALTDDGLQCRNSARGSSKYCSSHKGYQPKTVEGVVRDRDTAPRTKGAADILPGEDAWEPSEYQAQCAALTDKGMQCRNSSQEGSKFCASHHGSKTTKKGFLGKLDTKPRWLRAKDTKPATRKS